MSVLRCLICRVEFDDVPTYLVHDCHPRRPFAPPVTADDRRPAPSPLVRGAIDLGILAALSLGPLLIYALVWRG